MHDIIRTSEIIGGKWDVWADNNTNQFVDNNNMQL